MDAVAPQRIDWAAWCLARGIDMHHPEDWPDAEWDAYVEALRVIVRPDADPDQDDWRARRDRPMWPPARRSPWAQCPCHPLLGTPARDEIGYPSWPSRKPDGPEEVPDKEVAAWVAEDPAGRAFVNPQVQRALAFIERFNPAKRTAVVA